MNVKRMSKNFVSKIQQNLRPLSTHLTSNDQKKKSKNELKNSFQISSSLRTINIQDAYKSLKQNAEIDSKSNIKIITCLKAAQKFWAEYINNQNKNGQLACLYQMRLQKIDKKIQQQLGRLIIKGQFQKIKQFSQLLKPMIKQLQERSRKFKQHESEFKVISRKIQQQENQRQEKQDQIKEQMIDLVQKFKRYVVNIQQNLTNDTKVIKQINDSQDKHLESLTNKNNSMEQIIKQQKLGFFQLMGMGVFAIVMWVIGLMVIIII